MQPEKYVAMNAKYLEEGEKLLEQEDYPQASEKLWGAVAQAVKVIAERRRWQHSSHRDLRGAIDRLYRESGDEEVPRLFSVAESLHANFYEDFMASETVRLYAGDVKRLVEKLQSLTG